MSVGIARVATGSSECKDGELDVGGGGEGLGVPLDAGRGGASRATTRNEPKRGP